MTTPNLGDLVRERGTGRTLGTVVGLYWMHGEYQLAIDPAGDSVPMDQVHVRARDVEVEARL